MNHQPANPPRVGIRLALLASVLGASLWVGACGAGVGGTGTDSVAGAFIAYDARPAPVCASPIAVTLDCGATTANPSGTGPLSLLDTAPALRYVAVYSGNSVTLDDRCSGARFLGEWARTAGGVEQFVGVLATPGTAGQLIAAMTVGASGATQQTIELRLPGGDVLVTSRVLQRTAAPLPAANCN